MIEITINSITEKDSVIQTITVDIKSNVVNNSANESNQRFPKKSLLDLIDVLKKEYPSIPVVIKTKYGKNVNIVNGKSGRYFRTDGDKNPDNDLIDMVK